MKINKGDKIEDIELHDSYGVEVIADSSTQ